MIEKITDTVSLRQKLTLDDRKQLSLNGVKEVDGFSDKEVILNTNLGRLTIRGETLKISKLNVDTGDFCVTGNIISLVYSKSTQSDKGGFLEKLFR